MYFMALFIYKPPMFGFYNDFLALLLSYGWTANYWLVSFRLIQMLLIVHRIGPVEITL